MRGASTPPKTASAATSRSQRRTGPGNEIGVAGDAGLPLIQRILIKSFPEGTGKLKSTSSCRKQVCSNKVIPRGLNLNPRVMKTKWHLGSELLKGQSHAILVHFKNKKICPDINERLQIMVQFCYQRLYYFTKTIFGRLLLQMARMEMDCNLKKLG